MKTRTLLLLSVGTALAILVAGGVLLLQLSSGADGVEATRIGEPARVGDVRVVVLDTRADADLLRVQVEIEGVDDRDGVDAFRLVTGDQRLTPLTAPADGRCIELTVQRQQCSVDFDVSAAQTSSRVLVMRRGEDQANWPLDGATVNADE